MGKANGDMLERKFIETSCKGSGEINCEIENGSEKTHEKRVGRSTGMKKQSMVAVFFPQKPNKMGLLCLRMVLMFCLVSVKKTEHGFAVFFS